MRIGSTGVVAAALVALCACGGGGDGGGAQGDGGLAVSPAALTFSYVIGGADPSSQSLGVTWTATDAYYLVIGYPTGTPAVAWLSVGTIGGSGQTRTIPISVSTAGAVTGTTRTTTLRVVIARADQSIIAYRDVSVAFAVKTFGAGPSPVSASWVWGSSVAPDPKLVYAIGQTATAWTASTNRSWIHLSAASGTTPSPVTLTFDPTGLAIGTHAGAVTFSGGGETSVVPVTLSVTAPTLTITPSSVALAGLGGHDLSPKPVRVSLDTGANAYPFTVTSAAGWLELAGTDTTASSTAATFTVRPSAAAMAWPPGSHQDTITVVADVDGARISRTIGVSYVLDDLKLRVSDDGVALTSTPSLSLLSRALRVTTNRGIPAGWTATSNQAWLDVTPIGTTGPLVLTADPSGLSTDAIHEAMVTITSSDPGLAVTTASVQVGLWVGSSSPDPVTTVPAGFLGVAADPVRPYAYLSDGTAEIAVVNVHTGTRAATITVPGARLQGVAVSTDGARLFAVDDRTYTVVPVELATMSPGVAWPISTSGGGTDIAFARTNGVPVLVTSAGSVHAADTGARLATFASNDWYTQFVAASRDGSRVCTLNRGLSPYSLRCWGLDATTSPGAPGPIVVGEVQDAGYSNAGNGKDVALSRDGRRVYVAAGGPEVYDASVAGALARLGGLPAASSSTAIDVGFDDRLYCGTVDVPDSARLYDASGAPVAAYQLGAVTRGLLAVSGDGLRLIAGTGTEYASTATKLVTVEP